MPSGLNDGCSLVVFAATSTMVVDHLDDHLVDPDIVDLKILKAIRSPVVLMSDMD
jgi:hypothetical protein